MPKTLVSRSQGVRGLSNVRPGPGSCCAVTGRTDSKGRVGGSRVSGSEYQGRGLTVGNRQIVNLRHKAQSSYDLQRRPQWAQRRRLNRGTRRCMLHSQGQRHQESGSGISRSQSRYGSDSDKCKMAYVTHGRTIISGGGGWLMVALN